MHPVLVFDSRAATEADIDRVTPLRSPGEASVIAAQRQALLRLVAEGKAHPFTWVQYPSAAVMVYGKVADAETFAGHEAQTFAKGAALVRARGGQPAGTQIKRIGNTVLILPATPPPGVPAAIGDLTKAS